MRFEDISVPEVYTDESWDFRFFLKFFQDCLTKLKYDTEHIYDIYDPLKCKKELLWMLGDTVGWKYEDRLPASFNRLVLLHFMKMMRYKGSITGVTFAAELNLAQFNLINYEVGYEYEDENLVKHVVKGKEILGDRLEDTSIPTNAVYVTPHTAAGFIDVVYFSEKKPLDACIEYIRPLGMYVFQHAGVRFDARTQLSIDARLTNINEMFESLGPTHVGHYTRDDYSRQQRVYDLPYETLKYNGYAVQATITPPNKSALSVSTNDDRAKVWYRNSINEVSRSQIIDPGYRALYSLQLSNNEHIVRSLMGDVTMPRDPIFSLGYGPQKDTDQYPDEPYYKRENGVTIINPKSYLVPKYKDTLYPNNDPYNLRYDRQLELDINGRDVSTLDDDSTETHYTSRVTKPIPSVNPIMSEIGDAIAINDSIFSETNGQGSEHIRPEYLGIDTRDDKNNN